MTKRRILPCLQVFLNVTIACPVINETQPLSGQAK